MNPLLHFNQIKFMFSIRHSLKILISCAEIFGLGKKDIYKAKEYLDYNEYSLSFDIIVTQLYEGNIKINDSFFQLITKVANELGLSKDDYLFVKELVWSESKIPDIVQKEISIVLKRY